MVWTLLGDEIPDPLSVDDNGSTLSVDDGGGSLTVDGTVSVNALPAGSNNIGDVDVLTMPVVQVGDNSGSLTVDGQFTSTTVNVTANGATAAIDLGNYQTVVFQCTAVGTGTPTFAFQQSNDNVNWQAASMSPSSNPATFSNASTLSLGVLWTGALFGRYFRFNVTSFGTGTWTLVVIGRSIASPAVQPVYLSGQAASSNVSVQNSTLAVTSLGGSAVGNADAGSVFSQTAAFGGLSFVYTGAWDRLRVPNIAKTATATASGNTAVWTPTSSKKFRLMRYRIDVSNAATLASGADLDITFQDASTGMPVGATLYVPASAGTALGSWTSGWCDLGQGILSASANNVLNVNLSAALTAGKVRVQVAGIEE